ncbi:MAG: hypothetical protein WAS49_04295 [Candidatus Dechloromonas phosphoritropha]|nr:hypothetical protein [Candidatus Dechloromonas phosphoritropha]
MCSDLPRQQVADAVDRVIRDARNARHRDPDPGPQRLLDKRQLQCPQVMLVTTASAGNYN